MGSDGGKARVRDISEMLEERKGNEDISRNTVVSNNLFHLNQDKQLQFGIEKIKSSKDVVVSEVSTHGPK